MTRISKVGVVDKYRQMHFCPPSFVSIIRDIIILIFSNGRLDAGEAAIECSISLSMDEERHDILASAAAASSSSSVGDTEIET